MKSGIFVINYRQWAPLLRVVHTYFLAKAFSLNIVYRKMNSYTFIKTVTLEGTVSDALLGHSCF